MGAIKKSLTLMCIIYTAIISVMFFLGWMVSDSQMLFVPTPGKALVILIFSAVLGFASLCLSRNGTSAIRLILHFVICTAAYILAFVVGGGFKITGGGSIVAVLAFCIVYAIVMIIRAVICRKYRRQNVESEEYTSVFK